MRVLLFGHLKSLAGCSECDLPADDITADELWTQLLARFPAFAQSRPRTRIACNGEFATPDARFSGRDEIALIPPVSGG